jgi:hypothetical protein
MSTRIVSVPHSIAEIDSIEYGYIPVSSIDEGDTVIASVKDLLITDGYIFVPNTKAVDKNKTNCVRAFKGVKFLFGQKTVVNVFLYRTRMGLLHVDINR